jgi:hypothetical protein
MTIRRFTHTLTAVFMAVGLTFAAGISPAAAAVKPNVDPATVVAVIKQIYSIYQQFAGGSGALTLPQAVQEIEAQIQSSQTAIIDQIDLVATASVQACAHDAVINYADINAMTPDTLQAFALNATSCVTNAQSLISVVSDKAAVDALGFAMNTVGPIALTARIMAGFTTPALKATLAAGDNTVISTLTPDCNLIDLNGGEPGAPHIYRWDCVAYNGTEAIAKLETTAQDKATANTSRAVAQAALPTLS